MQIINLITKGICAKRRLCDIDLSDDEYSSISLNKR